MADYENNKQQSSFTLFNNETGKSYELPIIKGTDGPNVLDILFKIKNEIVTFSKDKLDSLFNIAKECVEEILKIQN